jgi:hypothetical protein
VRFLVERTQRWLDGLIVNGSEVLVYLNKFSTDSGYSEDISRLLCDKDNRKFRKWLEKEHKLKILSTGKGWLRTKVQFDYKQPPFQLSNLYKSFVLGRALGKACKTNWESSVSQGTEQVLVTFTAVTCDSAMTSGEGNERDEVILEAHKLTPSDSIREK